MKIFFNSSLPRSGSTLLQNILAQNPRFYCSPTSGLIELLFASRTNFTTLDDFKLQSNGDMTKAWLGYCRGAVEGFYSALTDRPVAIDKSRGWIYYYEWLKSFYPNPKIICCVRDLRAVVSSMEKLHRRNGHLHDPSDKPAEMNFVTVDQRVAHWFRSPPVGLALNRLMDSFQKGNSTKFFFFVYERFMADPSKVMDEVYRYLDEDTFTHDFTHIEQTVSENDAVHGVYGDHKIRESLSKHEDDWNRVLGSTISSAIVANNKWFYDEFYS